MFAVHAEHFTQRVAQGSTLWNSKLKPDILHEEKVGVEAVVVADSHDPIEGNGDNSFAIV